MFEWLWRPARRRDVADRRVDGSIRQIGRRHPRQGQEQRLTERQPGENGRCVRRAIGLEQRGSNPTGRSLSTANSRPSDERVYRASPFAAVLSVAGKRDEDLHDLIGN